MYCILHLEPRWFFPILLRRILLYSHDLTLTRISGLSIFFLISTEVPNTNLHNLLFILFLSHPIILLSVRNNLPQGSSEKRMGRYFTCENILYWLKYLCYISSWNNRWKCNGSSVKSVWPYCIYCNNCQLLIWKHGIKIKSKTMKA